MAPSQSTKSAKANKNKAFHPDSRKAHQLARKALRKDKRSSYCSRRSQKHDSRADMYGFFFHALPDDGILSLEELHGIIRDMLARNDEELEQERAARRKGRPKSVKETKLEDTKLVESELYRTGIEVLDLTHSVNVYLFRQWDQKEVSYVDHLRHIRVFSQQPQNIVVSRPGKHQLLIKDASSKSVTLLSES